MHGYWLFIYVIILSTFSHPNEFPKYIKREEYNKKKLFFCVIIMLMLISFNALSAERLKLGTTTSVDNSGLLKVLLPLFEKMLNVRVDVIAVGTGKAMELGRNGDVDLIFVHAKDAEEQFVREGFGVNRRAVMFNDFVILGSASDPAGIKGMKDAVLAVKKIASTESSFMSRGDNSGTHQREKMLWNEAKISPSGSWYMESGQGMGATLQMADEKETYVLCDRGTYLAYKSKIDLKVIVEGDLKKLGNPYSIIAVNPAKHRHVNYVYSMALIGWITSVEGQKIIGELKTPSGELLFQPTAIPMK